MDCLLSLKAKLDQKETASSHVAEYQQLGWVLQALNPRDGTSLPLDADADPETWVNRFRNPGLSGPEINLGVQTGERSRIMVLEVAKGPDEAVLDRYGPWRAECVAVLGTSRERHFYAWQPSPLFDSVSLGEATACRWYGEGQVILVPPSMEPKSLETWQWQRPPWETPPQPAGQAVADFLQQHLTREPQLRPEVKLSWQEVYCLVSPFEPLLQALSATGPSMQEYYQEILVAAAAVGLKDPEVLLAVLWRAPRGNARQHPEGLDYLKKLVAAAQIEANPSAGPEKVPWEALLDDARSQAGESSAGSSGPAGFPGKNRMHPSQPQRTRRTPFSCRHSKGSVRKI